MKVAIVHDWFVGGGAEKVVYELHKMFPDAPIYTSYCSDEWRNKLGGKVVTGYLQKWPFSKLRKFIPFLRGWWFQKLKFDNYDFVISSSGAEAKFIKTKAPTLHIAYIHAPTHYYWDRYNQYLKNPGLGIFNWLGRLGLKILVGPMRKWDYRAAQRPDYLIANSKFTKDQIKKYYGREAVVVYPPVDVRKIKAQTAKLRQETRKGFVTAGRQTPYKRFDLAVKACTKLGLPLTVIGDGPEHKKLQKLAGSTINFVGRIDDGQIAKYFCRAEAFIFPGLDDFGIVAIEAMAAGTPVIAYKAGGALDYIKPKKNGEFFDKQTVESLVHVLKNFDSNIYNRRQVSQFADKYSPERFRSDIKKEIKRAQNKND